MSFLVLGSVKSQASQQAAVSGLQLQSSAYGKAIPIVYGTTRIAPNLIWYGDFVAIPQSSSSGGGGKGGAPSGGGKGGGTSSYTYQTAVALGLCEGPIENIGDVFVNNSITTIAALGLSEFNGAYGQATWGYLTSVHPDQAVAYSGIAYLATSAYQLGTSAQLPNHNFEVMGIYANSLTSLGVEDADPSLVVADLLSNPHYGAGFPASRIGDLSVYQAYCLATGLWISPAYTTQAQASSMFDDLATATNSAFVWSSGVLTLVPYGDQSISANGYSYAPPSAPLYNLTTDDFMANSNVSGSSGTITQNDPILMTRKRPSDAINSIKVEVLDRNNSYNPAVIESDDLSLIERFGLRQSGTSQMHMFADMNAGQVSARLQLQRQYIRNVYQFTLDQRYVLLDPMDIVTITDANLGLNQQWVRINEITENDDGSLSIVAEEYLSGTGSAPLYSYQQGQGFANNYNASPGNANAPVIFEPTAELAESLEVWMAVSGGALWGGCDVYISNDGSTYKNAGRIVGAARTGVLTASLPEVTIAATGQTIDVTDTLAVDLSQSNGQLLSGSQSDAVALTTLCYVDGEYIAYQTATLTGSNQYSLSWLVRGAYDSPVSVHAVGSSFVRIDSGIFKFAYTQDFIGSTIYIKLVSFNIYEGGGQTLADVQPYAYTLQGTAFSSPLPTPQNLTTSYVAALTQLTWDIVDDFRTVQYEIRKGTAWNGAQVLARVAAPPYTVQGDGTYWVSAYSQPLAGLQVYSETPADIIITGSAITSNVIASYDEAATGWTGALGGTAVVSGSDVITSGSGNILTDANFLGTANILFYGGGGSGTYTIPSAHVINIGRAAPCQVLITWTSQGVKITDNILAVYDYLGDTDILDWAASANTDVYPQIALSQNGTTWGAWQQYAPGSYSAMAFKAQMQIQVNDPQTQAILSGFVFSVDVPDRDDHYVNVSIASGGTTITFKPDGSATATPFNGGPQGSPSQPAIQVTILNASSGDVVVVSSVSLSSCTIQVLNGGVGVARSVNVLVQGY